MDFGTFLSKQREDEVLMVDKSTSVQSLSKKKDTLMDLVNLVTELYTQVEEEPVHSDSNIDESYEPMPEFSDNWCDDFFQGDEEQQPLDEKQLPSPRTAANDRAERLARRNNRSDAGEPTLRPFSIKPAKIYEETLDPSTRKERERLTDDKDMIREYENSYRAQLKVNETRQEQLDRVVERFTKRAAELRAGGHPNEVEGAKIVMTDVDVERRRLKRIKSIEDRMKADKREAERKKLLQEVLEAQAKEKREKEAERKKRLKLKAALAQRKPATIQEIERKKNRLRKHAEKIKEAEREKRARSISRDLELVERAFLHKREIIDLCQDDEPPKPKRRGRGRGPSGIIVAAEQKSQMKFRVTEAFKAYVDRQKRRNCDSMDLETWVSINGATATNIKVDDD